MKWFRASMCAYLVVLGQRVEASTETNGPNGINSLALAFDGSGIAVGQVEPGRPGLPGFDLLPGNVNSTIVPAGVFVQGGAATADTNVSAHAEQVAGAIISTDATDSDADLDIPTGVAIGADLYASAYITSGAGTTFRDTL